MARVSEVKHLPCFHNAASSSAENSLAAKKKIESRSLDSIFTAPVLLSDTVFASDLRYSVLTYIV